MRWRWRCSPVTCLVDWMSFYMCSIGTTYPSDNNLDSTYSRKCISLEFTSTYTVQYLSIYLGKNLFSSFEKGARQTRPGVSLNRFSCSLDKVGDDYNSGLLIVLPKDSLILSARPSLLVLRFCCTSVRELGYTCTRAQ